METLTFILVRMMGTEGRRPGNDIPPLDEVYDIVIFRSADIDDLQIFETPAPAAAAPPKPSFVDPAIVSSVIHYFSFEQVFISCCCRGILL